MAMDINRFTQKSQEAVVAARESAEASNHQYAEPLHILVLQVIEETPAFSDQHEQAPPAVMVLFVDLQMLGEMGNALGNQRHLDFRRTGIGGVLAELFNNGLGVIHLGNSAGIGFGNCSRGRG